MKHPFLKRIALGFALAAGYHVFQPMACKPKEEVTPVDPNKPITVDTKVIEENAELIENAFIAADATALKGLMSPTAQETYKDLLPSMASGMKKYGDAFAQRKLEYATPMYAVYSFTIDGQRYTAAMAYQESKIWKLVRI